MLDALSPAEAQLITLGAGVVGALVGYAVTYLNSLRLKRLDAQYEHVTAQLRDLFGPLHALARAKVRIWAAFRSEFRPGRRIFADPSDPMTEDEKRVYAFWLVNVFQPTNRRMKEVIERNAHLFAEPQLPEIVFDFLAHANLFEAVVAACAGGDYSRLNTPVRYPAALDDYIEKEYLRVSALHAKLSGRRIGGGMKAASRAAAPS